MLGMHPSSVAEMLSELHMETGAQVSPFTIPIPIKVDGYGVADELFVISKYEYKPFFSTHNAEVAR